MHIHTGLPSICWGASFRLYYSQNCGYKALKKSNFTGLQQTLKISRGWVSLTADIPGKTEEVRSVECIGAVKSQFCSHS